MRKHPLKGKMRPCLALCGQCRSHHFTALVDPPPTVAKGGYPGRLPVVQCTRCLLAEIQREQEKQAKP